MVTLKCVYFVECATQGCERRVSAVSKCMLCVSSVSVCVYISLQLSRKGTN